jgi:hypothetical protein
MTEARSIVKGMQPTTGCRRRTFCGRSSAVALNRSLTLCPLDGAQSAKRSEAGMFKFLKKLSHDRRGNALLMPAPRFEVRPSEKKPRSGTRMLPLRPPFRCELVV